MFYAITLVVLCSKWGVAVLQRLFRLDCLHQLDHKLAPLQFSCADLYYKFDLKQRG